MLRATISQYIYIYIFVYFSTAGADLWTPSLIIQPFFCFRRFFGSIFRKLSFPDPFSGLLCPKKGDPGRTDDPWAVQPETVSTRGLPGRTQIVVSEKHDF